MSGDYPNFRRAQRGTIESADRRRGSRDRTGRGFLPQLLVAAALMFVISWQLAPQLGAAVTALGSAPEQNRARERSRYFSGCREARAAGAAPSYRGQPGYREELDGDSDGIACEPYRGM